VTILGPSIDWHQDAFGHPQNPVISLWIFLWPCIAPDGKDSAVSGGQAHGHDLVGGQLPAQGFPGGVDALVKKSARVSVPEISANVSFKRAKIRFVPVNAAAQRMIEDYLALTGRRNDVEGALFRPVNNNRTGRLDRHLDPDSVYQNIVRKYGLEAVDNTM
jgi:hypothetical protein